MDSFGNNNLEKRRGRKMVDLDIQETSAVDHPGHLAEGWLVMKSVSGDQVHALFDTPEGHRHRADVDYLGGMSLGSARYLFNTDTIPAGTERPIGADVSRSLGRSSCGCLYFRSPESVARAADDEYVKGRVAKTARKHTWTADEAAFLTAEANKLLGRGR